MSRQTKRAIIILIGVFVILTPLALSLVNKNTNLSGAAIVTDQQTDGGDTASSGDNNPPPDTSAQQDNSGGDTSAAQPAGDTAPTAVPPTAVPPTPVPPTAVPTAIPPTAVPPTAIPPTDVPPTDVPPTEVPPTSAPEASVEPNIPTETTTEPVVGEIPTAETTEVVTPPPESTSEIVVTPESTSAVEVTQEATPTVEITPESTSEFEITPEATAEITPEATLEPGGFAVGASCTTGGVEFTITNLGEDMTSAESYSVDGAEAGSVTLTSGESQTVTAGFGTPSLTIGDAQASIDTPCAPPPQLSVAVECTLDSGVVFTIVNAGGSMESEQSYTISLEGSDVSSGTFQLGEGENTTIQAGFGDPSFTAGDLQAQMIPACVAAGHVEGRVWQDLNNDGLAADSEPGLAGVIISLISDDGSSVQTVTIEDGHYDFFPVGEGHYGVQIQDGSVAADLQNSVDPDGENDAVSGVTVAAGGDYALNFGYQVTGAASISGVVWLENNNFGVLDAGETGIAGVGVQLLDASGAVLAETVSGADGSYRFDGLGAGSYTIRLVGDTLPQPYSVTFDRDGDHNLETLVSTSSGENIANIDFGIAGTEVAGRIWQDLNGDGLFGDEESGIAGVIVTLTNDDGSSAQTVTTEAGRYDFFPVSAGHYLVQIQADSLPPDMLNTADPDSENDSATALDAAAGQVYSLNFGYQPTGTSFISGHVWLETGNFGVRDPGEKGVNGASIQLLDVNGNILAETGLGADGSYQFAELGAGNYSVQVVADTLPQPYGVTFDSDGDHNLETFVSLSSGQSTENIDFGIVGTF
ncbi:MAG: SdrD B-like domain-containing protein [Chloroflexota bacterium]